MVLPKLNTRFGARFNFPVCLAPMVGLSHLPMRRLLQTYLPPGVETLWPTEMLNSRRLPSERVGSTLETLRDATESNLVPQILGNEEPYIASSVKKLEQWGASAIDINMGCPVQKALKHNYGVALMGDATYAREVVSMTVRSTRLPVSVKLRSGHVRDLDYLVDFIAGIESERAAWVTIHPRLASEARKGRARWQELGLIRQRVSLPIIGNGDVQIADDVFAMRDQTSCDMVMIGRALTARPWLFWQVGEREGWPPPLGRSGEKAPQSPTEEGREYGRALKYLLDQFVLLYPEAIGVRRFHFFVRTGASWLVFGQSLYGAITRARSYEQIAKALAAFFAVEQPMLKKTDWRS